MKTKNTLLIALFTGAAFISGNAQSLQSAISKTDNERFEEAAAELKALTTASPNNGEYWFYYGENYFKRAALDNFTTADVDSAKAMYQKGFELNSTNPLPYIGLGKINLIEGKEADANANFFKANTLIDPKKPNPSHQLKLAEAYLAVPKMRRPDDAIKILQTLVKTDGKNPEVHIVMGDALFFQNSTNAGEAVKSYNKAAEMDKKSARAIMKIGKLYKMARNEKTGLEYFQNALKIDSLFAPSYREMAELYHEFSKDARALENMEKYVRFNNSDGAKKRLVEFMFVMKMYCDVIPKIIELQEKGMKSCFLYRYLGWSYYECGDKTDKAAFKKGMEAMENFFTCSGADFKYLPEDYKYQGLLLSKAYRDSVPMLEKAISVMKKAIDVNKEANCELYTEIGTLYMKMKKYTEAIETFKSKEACPNGLNGTDFYHFGRAYFYSKDYINADTTFGKLLNSPNLTPVAKNLGLFWRGRSNTYIDPKNEKWLAKQWYEAYFNGVKPEERSTGSNKEFMQESIDYLINYYLKQNDNEKAKMYFDVINQINPAHPKIPTWKKIFAK
jgi:tetratricopeptide (TPR) repeat protein